MVPKEKKEVPAPPKAEAKAKALKAKKAVLKVVHNYRVKIYMSPTFWLPRQPKYPQESSPRKNKLDCYAITKFPMTTELAIKKTENNNVLVFIVDVKRRAHVQLAPDYDALDVANKIGSI
jgi:large subunit ribosomal protein L23Ae